MRLLIVTQKVDIDDDNLGFFHRWIEKFSEKLDEVYVICLWQGKYDLPKNVHIFSLGKEKNIPKIGQLYLLQKYLIKTLSQVDGVFVHMCPIYAIMSFPLVKIYGKKMILWFVHKSVSWKLKLVEKLVDEIITASKESCRLRQRGKIKIIGHGIDVDRFKSANNSMKSDRFRIFSAGRIAPSKDLQTFIKALDILVNKKNIKDLEVKIAGSPSLQSERKYLEKMKKLVRDQNLQEYIEFLGGIPYLKMPEYFRQANIFVNLSHTGSLDKVVLEAMASGCLVLTCNEAYKEILEDKYIFEKKNPEDLAKKIIPLMSAPKDEKLREMVVKYHNLDNLIDKIIYQFGHDKK